MKTIDPSGLRTGLAFLLVFILLAVGIITAGYIYYRNYEQTYRAEEERQLSAIAELKVDELTRWRDERIADASIFFKNPSFFALVRRFFEKPEDADAQGELRVWLGRVQSNYHYDRIVLLDAQGIERLAVPGKPEPVDVHLAQEAAAVQRSSRVTFQDFHRHAPDSPIHLDVMAPILDERNSRHPLGALVLRINPCTYLYPFLKHWPTPSLTAETQLVRREGNEAVFLNELRFQTNAALNLRVPLDCVARPAAQAVLGRERVMEGTDYWDIPVVAALRAIPDSPWALVARMDTAEVYAPVRERFWQVVVVIGVLIFGAGACVDLIWRHQRSRFYRERATAAEMIREGEKKFQSLFENTLDAIMTIQPPSWRFTSGNPACVKMFRAKSEEEFISFGPWELSPDRQPDGRASGEKAREMIETAVREGSHFFEWMHRRIGGEEFPAEVLLTRVEQGGKMLVHATVRDITERKRAEAALRESEARYHTLFNQSADGILIADVETKTFKYANPALCRMLGYTEDELRTMGVLDIHPKDAVQSAVAEFEALARRDKTLAADIPCLRKDGSVVHVDINGTRITIDDRPCNVGFFRDITERKRVEAALRESEKRLHEISILQGLLLPPSPLDQKLKLVTETVLRIVGADFARIWMIAPGDRCEAGCIHAQVAEGPHVCRFRDRCLHLMVSSGRYTHIDGRDHSRVPFGCYKIGKVAAGEEPKFLTNEVTTDARVHNHAWAKELGLVSFAGYRLVDAEGVPLGVLALFSKQAISEEEDSLLDVIAHATSRVLHSARAEEEIRRLNAELEQRVTERTAELQASNKELEAFSYSVAHDLRAPLRAVDGFGSILLEDYAKQLGEEGRRTVGVICAEGKRMGRLIDSLLEFSRLSRTPVQATEVDMNALAQSVFDQCAAQVSDRKLQFKLHPLPPARGDTAMLHHVWIDLISNAVKYTRPKPVGEIEITGRAAGGEVIYCVRDNGVGFDMKYANDLFRVFHRLHDEAEFEGTGVGLALVQGIIRRHGGRVWVESTPNDGAAFYFALPARGA